MAVETPAACVLRVARGWTFVSGTGGAEDCVHAAGTEGTLGACRAYRACHQEDRTEAYRREDSSLEDSRRTASWHRGPSRRGEVGAWSYGGRVCLREHPAVAHVHGRQSSRSVLQQREARRRGWVLHLLARMGSHCIHIDDLAARRRVPADRAREVVRQDHPGRDCSAGRTSYWAHSHWGWVAEERGPTGREDGVERAPAVEGHRGSRRGCPDFPSERIEAFAVAASNRVLNRACWSTCGEALRGQVCAVQTCGVHLAAGEREALGQGQCGASLLVLDAKPSPKARSRQCSPTPRRLPPTRPCTPGCQTRPGHPTSLPLRRCMRSAPHPSSC